MAHDSFHGTATRNGQRFMEAIIHKRFSARIMNTAIYTANRRDGSKGGPSKCNRVESRACKIFSRSIGVREIDTNFPFPFSKRVRVSIYHSPFFRLPTFRRSIIHRRY